MHKIEGAHLQCVNNHYAKFESKGLNNVRVEGKMSKLNTRQKLKKKINVNKIRGAHLQFVNNHYAKSK